jgi:predicted nucleic acid-binding protein
LKAPGKLDSDAVTNSTCLIGLERIERLDILPQVFSIITVPTAVAAEVGIEADWLIVRKVQNLAVVATLKTQVDSGEAEAIALAIEED